MIRTPFVETSLPPNLPFVCTLPLFPHCLNCMNCMILFRVVQVPRTLLLVISSLSTGTIPKHDHGALVSSDSDPHPPLNPTVGADPDDDCCGTCWDHSGLEHMPSIASPFAISFPCMLTCAGTCSHLTSLPGFAISWSSISQTGTWTCSLPDVVVHPFDFQCCALPVAPSCRYYELVMIASFGTQNPCRASSAAHSSAPLFVCL